MKFNEFSMKKKHIEMIHNGEKITTLRSLKYDYPYRRIKLRIPDDLTDDIYDLEGGYTKDELIFKLEHITRFGGHILPKDMWLYFLWEKQEKDE